MVSTKTVSYLPSLERMVRRKEDVREGSTVLCGCGVVNVSNSEGVSPPESGQCTELHAPMGSESISRRE